MLGSCRLNTDDRNWEDRNQQGKSHGSRIRTAILIFVNSDALSSLTVASGIAALIFEIPTGSIYDNAV
jgi:hypothetical protein